jgi:hypothetical protein
MNPVFEIQIGELPLWRGEEKAARVAYENNRPIIITHSQPNYAAAANLLEAIALQLWANHPAGDAVLTLYEARPSPLFAHIKRVLAQTQRALGTQVLDAKAFNDHLTSLSTLAHNRFSLLANSGVDNLVEYNALPNTHLREKTQYLLISELLIGSVRESDLHALENICHQGGKVGIIPLLLHDSNFVNKENNELGRKFLYEFWKSVLPIGFGFNWNHHPPQPVNQYAEYWRIFPRYGFEIGVPDGVCKTLVDNLIASVTHKKKTSSHANFLDVPIGRSGNVTVNFQMGASSGVYNALLGGTVGTGKSTIVHNVLLHACEQYSPEQLRLWIVDFSGVGFTLYGDLSHVDFLYTNLNIDSVLLNALEQFQSLWETRVQALREVGAENITEYNKNSGKNMPRCLLVVDEAHKLFADRTGRNLIGTIAKEGRKFGLHLILITPSFQELPFDDSVRDQIQLRIGCKLNSESASRNLFGHGNEAAAHLENTEDIRMAIVNHDAGRPHANQTVHLHDLPKEERKARLIKLTQQYPNSPKPNYTKPQPSAPQPQPTQTTNTPRSNSKDLPDWLKR